MQELSESEVTLVEVDGEVTELHDDGTLHKRDLDDGMLSEKAIRQFMHRFGWVMQQSRRSPHRRGIDLCTATPKHMALAKRRARNKVAKRSRKVNRGSYTGR